MTPAPVRHHLATLDGLRGLAALAVLLVHMLGELHLRSSTHIPFEQFIPHTHLAVDFFFMLSGFVIARAYEAKLQASSLSFSRFLSIRLVRLYPLIFIGVALGAFSLAVRVLLTRVPSPGQWLLATGSALFLLPTSTLLSVFPGELFPIDFPQWSLFFELLVNVVYALLVRWLTTAGLIALCIVSFVALCATGASSDRLLDVGMGVQRVGLFPADIWCGFIRVTFPFFLGILLFRCPLTPRRLHGKIGNGASALLSLALLATLLLPAFKHSWIYEVFAVGVLFPAILAFAAISKTTPTLNLFFLALGELSYPLYITHTPVTRIFLNAMQMLHLHLPPLLAAALGCLTAITAAILLLHLWDRPLRRWLADRLLQPVSRPVSRPADLDSLALPGNIPLPSPRSA